MLQEPISGWTDAETTSSRRPEEWRLQRAAVAHFSAIVALLAGHLHYPGRYTMALDADVLHPELLLILAGFRGDLVRVTALVVRKKLEVQHLFRKKIV